MAILKPVPGEQVRPVTRASRAAAALALLAILLITALAVPVESQPIGLIPALQPIFATIGIVTQTLIAWLLLVQFRVTRDAAFAGLAGAYLFAVVLIALHLASFPGVFADPPPLGATRQGTVWLWTLWHGGFPLLVASALLLRRPAAGPALRTAAGLVMPIAAPLLALLLGALATVGGGVLPPLVADDPDATRGPSAAAVIVVLLNGSAMAVCVTVTGLRDRLSLWLAVTLVAGLADTLLTRSGTMRFSIGWYAAQVQGVIMASMVLGVLIRELASLCRRLIDSHRALEERSVRDPLTGAFNRGYFIEQFPREFRRASREGTPLSLLMVDVDYFKRFNDSAGHLAGDRALIALVEVFIRTVQRPADAVSRYGGEEFAVVLPNTPEAGALRVAGLLLDAVRAQALPRSDEFGPAVTVSIGIATMRPSRDDGMTPDDLIEHADDALYRAKHRGRDRIEMHESADALLARREAAADD